MMWDWQGYGWWWWPLMIFVMVLFWGAVVWVMRDVVRKFRREHSNAEDMLEERFVRGEIDAHEFHERVDVLRRSRGSRAA